MKKISIIISAAVLLMSSCGALNSNNTNDSIPGDSLDVAEMDAAELEPASPYYSADLQTHGIMGKVTSAVTKIYAATANGKQEGFLYDTKLMFNEAGEWTGNEMAKFDKSKIKRNESGRITSVEFSAGEDNNMTYVYGFSYEGERTKTYGYDAEGEFSSGCNYTLSYNNEGDIVKEKGDGDSEGTNFDITIEYTIKERDDCGNWTKRFVKKVTKESYYDAEPGTPADVSTEYTMEVRKLTYAE